MARRINPADRPAPRHPINPDLWEFIGWEPEYSPCRRWGGCPGAHFSTFRECEDFIRAYAAEHGLIAPRSCELRARRDYRVEYCPTYRSRRAAETAD